MKGYTLTWSVNKFTTYTKDMDSKTIYMHNIDENTYLYNYGYYFVEQNPQLYKVVVKGFIELKK